MPTTDQGMLDLLLDELRRSGVTHAILHNTDALRSGDLRSDLDIAVDRHPDDVLRMVAERSARRGAVLVCKSHYAAGGWTSFWMSPDGVRGAQLDMAWDPDGRSRFGFRTAVAIERSVASNGRHVLDPIDQLAYELRKRAMKGDTARAAAAAARLRDIPTAVRSQRVRELFGRHASVEVLRHIEGGLEGSQRPTRHKTWPHEIARLAKRTARPIGAVVSLGPGVTDQTARKVAAMFDAVFVDARVVDRSSIPQRLELEVRRRRPTVSFVRGRVHRPDALVADVSRTGDIAERVVAALGVRESVRLHAVPLSRLQPDGAPAGGRIW